MEIKTKYKIGDCVWVNYEGYVRHWTIREINIKVRNLIQITYELKPMSSGYLFTFKENEIFQTEEELKKAMGV